MVHTQHTRPMQAGVFEFDVKRSFHREFRLTRIPHTQTRRGGGGGLGGGNTAVVAVSPGSPLGGSSAAFLSQSPSIINAFPASQTTLFIFYVHLMM